MPLIRGTAIRWGIVIVCVILGTFMGIFFQNFDVTRPLFRNIMTPEVTLNQVDLLAVKFSLYLNIKFNLGTLFGGIIGLWLARKK